MDEKRVVNAQRTGLVLAGGGGKGAYQIGVWEYLLENGWAEKITAVSGTSVGSLNAAMFVGGSFERAQKIWSEIEPSDIIPFKPELNQKGEMGLCSREKFGEIMVQAVDFEKISRSKIPCFVTSVNVTTNRPEYIDLTKQDEEHQKQYLLATSAFPLAFKPEVIDDHSYVDGGLSSCGDNVPIKPLYEMGMDTIIVVPLTHDYAVTRSNYPESRIIQIVPSKPLGNLVTGTLNFSSEKARELMVLGYEDARRTLEAYDAILGSVNRRVRKLDYFRESESLFLARWMEKQNHQGQKPEAFRRLIDDFLEENQDQKELLLQGVLLNSSLLSTPGRELREIGTPFGKSWTEYFQEYLMTVSPEEVDATQLYFLQGIVGLCEENQDLGLYINQKLNEIAWSLQSEIDQLAVTVDQLQRKFRASYLENEAIWDALSESCSCGQPLEENQFLCPNCGRIHPIKGNRLPGRYREALKPLEDYAVNHGVDLNPGADRDSWTQRGEKRIDLERLSQLLTYEDLFSRIQDRIPEFEEEWNTLNREYRRFSEAVLNVSLIGVWDSGKTTFVNALFGEEIAPADAENKAVVPVSYRLAENNEIRIYTEEKVSSEMEAILNAQAEEQLRIEETETEEQLRTGDTETEGWFRIGTDGREVVVPVRDLAELKRVTAFWSSVRSGVSGQIQRIEVRRAIITQGGIQPLISGKYLHSNVVWTDFPSFTSREELAEKLPSYTKDADFILDFIPTDLESCLRFELSAAALNALFDLYQVYPGRCRIIASKSDLISNRDAVLKRWRETLFSKIEHHILDSEVSFLSAKMFLQAMQIKADGNCETIEGTDRKAKQELSGKTDFAIKQDRKSLAAFFRRGTGNKYVLASERKIEEELRRGSSAGEVVMANTGMEMLLCEINDWYAEWETSLKLLYERVCSKLQIFVEQELEEREREFQAETGQYQKARAAVMEQEVLVKVQEKSYQDAIRCRDFIEASLHARKTAVEPCEDEDAFSTQMRFCATAIEKIAPEFSDTTDYRMPEEKEAFTELAGLISTDLGMFVGRKQEFVQQSEERCREARDLFERQEKIYFCSCRKLVPEINILRCILHILRRRENIYG